MIFGLILALVLQFYSRVRIVSEEYKEAKEIVGMIVLAFRGELQQQSQRLNEISKEITLLKAVRATKKDIQDDEIISEVTKLKKNLTQMERSSQSTTQELEQLKEKIEELLRAQKQVKTQLEMLDERYRGLLPETEAKQMTPIVPDTILSHLHSTEIEILHMLITEGPKSAKEIQQRIGKTREHAARLMKKLYDQGLVEREEKKRPYLYMASKKIKELVKKSSEEENSPEAATQ